MSPIGIAPDIVVEVYHATRIYGSLSVDHDTNRVSISQEFVDHVSASQLEVSMIVQFSIDPYSVSPVDDELSSKNISDPVLSVLLSVQLHMLVHDCESRAHQVQVMVHVLISE